jgi:hypothetical protein
MKSTLSNKFAMKIINKEIELETQCTLQNLKELVELYRVAIEYYEEIKDPKFWDFQKRLQKIFMSSPVIKMMQEENNKYKKTQTKTLRHLKSRNTHSQSTSTLNRSQTLVEPTIILEVTEDPPVPYKNVSRILETQKKRTENVSTRAATDLKYQERSLDERLANRKQKALNTSTDSSFLSYASKSFQSLPASPMVTNTSENFFFNFECDKSAGFNPMDQLQQRIESIMETNFSEKSEKITEIKVKYETQINELPEGGIYAEVIKEMRKEMKKEIEKVNEILDNKRRELIRQAKLEFI